MPYDEDRAVLTGLGACASWARTSRGVYLMDMRLMGMLLAGGTAQKVGTNELDNRRVGHSDSFNIGMIKCRAMG
jgi:hypothetical protein